MLAPLEARGIATSLEFDPAAELDVEREALCFRVAQEAVRNALKHSGADHVAVALQRSERRRPAARSATTAAASTSRRPAARRATSAPTCSATSPPRPAGRSAIDSAPGRGTVVALSLPAG